MNSFVSEDTSVLNSVNASTIYLSSGDYVKFSNWCKECISEDQSAIILITVFFPCNLYLKTNTDYHRIKECLRQEGTSGDHLQPTPCSELGFQDRVWSDFEYLQGWILQSLLSSLFWFLVSLSVTKVLRHLKWNFLCFTLCPLPLFLSPGTTEKILSLSVLTSVRYLYTWLRSLRAFSTQGHVGGSWSSSCSPGPTRFCLQSCFTASWPPACTAAWHCYCTGGGGNIESLLCS